MTDYIRREDAIDVAREDGKKIPTVAIRIMHDIKAIPAADVVPVVHGRWIPYRCDMYECSVCQRIHTSFDSGECDAYYCPYCGAKMDKE